MSKMFCPMCISGGDGTGSRKRKGRHVSGDSGAGSDNDDDNFYRPCKEALKSKTSSISISDPEQSFHVPSIFKPIRVDSPALFVRGSNSTMRSDSNGGGSSTDDAIFTSNKAVGSNVKDGNNAQSAKESEKLHNSGIEDKENMESSSDGVGKQKQSDKPEVGKESQEMHSSVLKNKADDISKPASTSSSSPNTKKSKGVGSRSPIVNIVRARPRPGSDFRKKLQHKQTGLPRTASEDDSILNPDDDHILDKDRNQECAHSLSSHSSRSLSVNYDSHCPDPEARQPLLLATSELDLVSDEEDEEGSEPELHTTPRATSPSGILIPTEDHRDKREKTDDKTSQTEAVCNTIEKQHTDQGPLMDSVKKLSLSYSSTNSSKSSTPAPPPLPDCPPPDSEGEWSARSGSNTRSPSRSRYYHPYRTNCVSCTASPSRDHLQSYGHHHHYQGTCRTPCSEFECHGAPDGGYTLTLADMTKLHYADSASSCCESDIGDVGGGDDFETEETTADKKYSGYSVGVYQGDNGNSLPITSPIITASDSRAAAAIDDNDNGRCVCHHADEVGNRNLCKDAGREFDSSLMPTQEEDETDVDRTMHLKTVDLECQERHIMKVSACVNTDIVMPPSFYYEREDGNLDSEMLMILDRNDSPEDLRSASTTPTPPKREDEEYGGVIPTRLLAEESPSAKKTRIKSSSITITLKTPYQTQTELVMDENKKFTKSDPILWRSAAAAAARKREIGYPRNSSPEMGLPMISFTKNNDPNQETRVLAEGFYYSELDLDLALRNKHIQASRKWHYPYHSTGHVPSFDDPRAPLVQENIEGVDDGDGLSEDVEEEEEHTIEDLAPLITTTEATTSVEEVDQSPQVHYRGVRTNVTGSWFSLSSSSSLEDYDESEVIMTYGSGESSTTNAIIAASHSATVFDPEKWTPESSPSLSVLSYEEILSEQQRIKQDVQKVVQSVRENFIDKKHDVRGGYALDLASQSNVQDAFVIAVEQQARERLEKLSALKKIKPVDMTKLSHQLSEAPSESGETSAELNGLIEAATGSPIYVTSASELNSSQSALHRTAAAVGAGGSEESQEGKTSSPARSTPTSTVTTRAVISSGTELSPSKRGGHNNVTVVGVNSSGSTIGGTCLPNGQYSSGVTTSSAGDRSTASSVGEPVLPAKKSTSKESVNGSRKSGSRESIADSRESVQFDGAKPSPSRSRGSASKLASQSSSRESVIEASSSSQYANMINMVEWDNGPHREMAVDVPESFVPRNKTPPRYPPTNKTTTLNSNNNKTAGKSVVSDGVGVRGNGATTLPGQNGAAGKPVPPPRIGDKEGVYGVNNNTTQVPHVTPRTVVGQAKAAAATTPSRDEAERIRKYQEELKKRREQEEKHAKEEEFLRTSLRGSKKLQALESARDDKTYPTGEPKGFVNQAYDLDGDRISHPSHDITLQKPLGLPELVASLQRVQHALKKHGVQLDEAVSVVGTLMQTPEFQQVLAVHNKVQDVWCFSAPPIPATCHAQQLNQECLESLYNCSSPASAELVEILSRIDMDGVLQAHDKIAERERLLMTAESPLNAGEPVDPVILPPSATSSTPAPAVVPAAAVVSGSHIKSVPRPAFVPEPQPDDHIKVVRIEKTQDPLGATVRNDGDAVVIGRIVKGGAAERSGLLHEGDEILEVNGVEMRGKSVNEVCDILSRMTGTLTFLIVPTQVPQPLPQRRDILVSLVHVRAHFDYDPEDDIYIPCRELGVAFAKGDVLHVINQEDPSWWQAHREGEEDQQLAGLIPSKSFQEQREAVKQTLLGETETREKSKKGTLLCAKTHKKKKKKIPYSSAFNDEFDAEEIPTYEEVALYYPRTSFKRPVVLIGPPNIGRHELRQRLMQESDRFAAAVPHTSRSRKDGEIDGQDYHFISRAQFESDILSRKFVEHGEFEKAYYGTSLDAIRSVVNAGRICVLNLHPQSLKILRSSDLKPYIVFIAPPPLERLKQMRIARGEAYKEDELIDIIEKAREMEEKYGHYFDLVIVNNDIERTYHELVQRINYIEREPQWVPAFWLKQ